MENEFKELAKEIKKITKNIQKCEEEMKDLPKGSIFVRKINNKKYVYRNRKVNKKVISQYLGPYYSPEVIEEMNKSKLYKKNKKMIKLLKIKLDTIANGLNKKYKTAKGSLTQFAININQCDGLKPSDKSIALLKLLEKKVIDLETYEFAIDRMYLNEE